MFEILIAQNKAEVWNFLCQKNGQNMVDFVLNYKTVSQDKQPWHNWNIANWSDLGNYIGSGQDGIFGFESQNTPTLDAIVWDSPSLVLDENGLKYLADQNNYLKQTVFIVVLKSDVNAALKKIATASKLKIVELSAIDTKIKQDLAKKYVTLVYPDLISKLDRVILNYLADLDWVFGILDTIDFMVLAELDSWSDFVSQNVKQNANIFQFNLSSNPTKNEIKILYELIQNADQNQLLYTMLFSKLQASPALKNQLQALILTDYKGKTVSNSLLWAKYWLYAIIV